MPLPVFTPITLAHHDFVGLLDQYVRTSLVSDLPATRLPHCSRETGGPQSTSGALQPPMEASLPELRVNTWIFSRRSEPSESENIHSSNLQYSATVSPVHAVVNQTEDWTPFDSRPETHTERLGKGTQNEQLNGPRLAAQGLLRPARTRRFSVSKNWRRSVKQVWLNQLANHLNEFRWLAGNFAKGPHRNNTVKALTPACFQELGF